MKDLPRISVVTPCLNQARFLEETINSVIGQGYPQLEYIIVDGESRDNSVEIIKKYENEIDYWVSEKDSGQADAINKGLLRSTGDVWAFICSDDTYNAKAFTTCARVFEDKEVDVVYGDCNFMNENSIVTRLKRPGPLDRKKLLHNNYLYQPSMFLRRWILDEFGPFDVSLHYSMDYEYWLRISKKAKFRYVSFTFANYRLHAASKTVGAVVHMVDESTRVKKQYGAGISADLTNYSFKLWGQHYYRTKRRFFEYLANHRKASSEQIS